MVERGSIRGEPAGGRQRPGDRQSDRQSHHQPDTDPALARIDAALMNLRHLWHAPGSRQPSGGDGVELSTIWVVEALSHADDGLTITELATALDVAQSTGSRLVERAVAAGMVQRGASATDARRVVLFDWYRVRVDADTVVEARRGQVIRVTGAEARRGGLRPLAATARFGTARVPCPRRRRLPSAMVVRPMR